MAKFPGLKLSAQRDRITIEFKMWTSISKARMAAEPNASTKKWPGSRLNAPAAANAATLSVSSSSISASLTERQVVDRVVVDRHAAADPPVGVVLLAQPSDFAPATHALQRGVQPQREQHARVNGRAARVAATGLDSLEQFAQILTHDVTPNKARRWSAGSSDSRSETRNSTCSRLGSSSLGAPWLRLPAVLAWACST